jgi:methylthioribose-1-phosphate isomerase
MRIEGKEYRSVWMEGSRVMMIDQPKIPHSFEIFKSKSYNETATAITTMIIRGAPAIGAAACYGMAQGALVGELDTAAEILAKARPTAYDLFDAIEYFKREYHGSAPQDVADAYADASAERCRMIGVHGEALIEDGFRILTHCNAGALACVDYGTAIAPMRLAHAKGKKIFVFADETRPRCQGARLTAWELLQEGINHAVIADNAAGHYMQRGEIDMVIVGTDRVAVNGDIANKIGTYEKAVLAKENGIPFYVAAPLSTIDFSCQSGDMIPIEERNEDEVKCMWGAGRNGIEKIQIAPDGSPARNPAFDVTPAKYITGLITENGVIEPKEVKGL